MITWFLTIVAGMYGVAILEQRIVNHRWKPLYFIERLKGITETYTLPKKRDKIFFDSAPIILFVAVVLAAAVLPATPGAIVSDLATGALFVSAALAYVMVALVLAGWAANTENGLIGGWRFLGQFIAYSMPVVMSITAVAMRSESLSTMAIVQTQSNLWNIVYQPLGFAVFFLSSMALAFLPPFDLPTAESEIRGGVFSSYFGWRRMVVGISRLLLIVVVSWATTIFYLGGWHGPWLPDFVWTVTKILLTATVMLSIGQFVPRITIDKLLAAAWKIAIPLALANIFIVGLMLLGGLQ